MSRFLINTLGAAFAAVLLTGVSGVALAEDKPATPPPNASPSEDSIAVAKREFDVIKSTRDPALQPKGGLPRMTVPDLQGGPGMPGPWAQQKKAGVGAEKKSANWLLEAMEKSSEQKKDRGHGKTNRESMFGRREKDAGADSEKSAREEEQDDRERKSTTEATNPLTRFLGTWMTPQDYALLKPGLDKSLVTGAGGPGNTFSGSFAAPLNTTLPGSDSAFGLIQSNQPAVAAIAPRENPYLQTPGVPASPMLVPLPSVGVTPSAASSAPASMLVGPAQPQPAKTKIPEFAKPAVDEKHFKQLKRF